jgi:hypothetical protein
METYRGKRAFDLWMAGSACLLFGPLVAAITLATVVEEGFRRCSFSAGLATGVDLSRSSNSEACVTGKSPASGAGCAALGSMSYRSS